jgi:hypothetical protein
MPLIKLYQNILIAVEKQALKKLTELEKKLLRAERFKYDTQKNRSPN